MDDVQLTRKGFLQAGIATAAGVWLSACNSEPDPDVAAVPVATPDAGAAAPQPGVDTTFAGPRYVENVENLKYNNPFGQQLDPAWNEGNKVFHFFLGAATTAPPYKVAMQYLPIRKSAYNGATTTVDDFMRLVKNAKVGTVVFDSVPGDANYSPIWHNHWVLVPDDYQADTLRSVAQVQQSGYEVVETPIWVN